METKLGQWAECLSLTPHELGTFHSLESHFTIGEFSVGSGATNASTLNRNKEGDAMDMNASIMHAFMILICS